MVTTCVRIGARPKRCYSKVIEMPSGNIVATCGGCSKTFHRYRMVKSNRRIWCIACGPEKGILTFKSTTASTEKESPPLVAQPYVPLPTGKLRVT